MLEARKITFGYDRKGEPLYEGFSLAVDSSECVVLHASSGAGKTTLCSLLAGYLKPWSGEILIDGKSLPKWGVCPVQMIGQHPERMLDPLMTIERSLKEAGPFSQELLDTFGVRSEWLLRYPSELSGGEMQRVCIVRALSVKPRYLICDEISTMLDAVTQAQIWSALKDYAACENVGMIAVTHSSALRERIATRVVTVGR